MAQVTIYLDDESERAARAAAAAARLPLSRWFAQFAEREKDRKRGDWQAFFDEIDKTNVDWNEFPLTEEMNRELPPDVPRESF